jgi:type VI secretion system protein ImpG
LHPQYREQLAFLRETGRDLASALPGIAHRLWDRSLDPDVERLLEGISFLVGSVVEKQERGIPALTQLLCDTLFPHFLSPAPAAAIVQFRDGRPGARVPRGTEILSVPVDETRCRFRTAYDVTYLPLKVAAVSAIETGSGTDLTLQLAGLQALPRVSAKADSLRVLLHGEPFLCASIYRGLLTQLNAIDLLDSLGTVVAAGAGIRVRAAGFGEDDALLPYPEGSFPGYRLLQEYFILPQKFLFIDLLGLFDQLRAVQSKGDTFGVRFHLQGKPLRGAVPHEDSFRLHATPVVNVFHHSADPVKRDPRETDYLVRPFGRETHFETYRLLEVRGYGPHGIRFFPLLSDLDRVERAPFAVAHHEEVGGTLQTLVSIVDDDAPSEEQTLICDLLCTNGMLPSGLRLGDINVVPRDFRPLRCQNITPVTPPSPATRGEDMRRRLSLHLALTQLPNTSLRAIRDVLSLYNFHAASSRQAAAAHQVLSAALMDARSTEAVHSHRRIPVRGRSTVLDVDESVFGSEGEMYLFGCVLNELIALQAPVNHFSEFALRAVKKASVFRWPKRIGRQLLEG